MARKQIQPSKRERKLFEQAANEAAFEGEFLAMLFDHPHTPDHIRGTIRFLMIAACQKLLAKLEADGTNGQMVRDIYPHAFLVDIKGFGGAFKMTLDMAEKDAARVVESIQSHVNRGEMPPSYPHPITSLLPQRRAALTGSMKQKGGAG